MKKSILKKVKLEDLKQELAGANKSGELKNLLKSASAKEEIFGNGGNCSCNRCSG